MPHTDKNLVLEHLRHIRSAVDALREDMREVKERLGSLEAEDAADIATFDACMAAREAGLAPDAPAEVTAAMLRGDSLLKALRKWKGLSQTELAERAGIGQGYLSDLEARRRKGTVETIEALAKALEINRAWLFEAEPQK